MIGNTRWECVEDMKTLDRKLDAILGGKGGRKDFIIADAKDADMGGGRAAPGPERDAEGRPLGAHRPLIGYLDEIRAITAQGIVDVMLVSSSTLERLGPETFRGSPVTPAIRANDTTDIWGLRSGAYPSSPSRPFRTASLARARDLGCDLCLYSITFNNRVDDDARSLEAFGAFREDAAQAGMRYFLEVFNPNVETGFACREEIGGYVGDCILRCLAGLTRAERPRFLKIAYNGPRSMAELCSYDPELVVGILGGAAGTNRDTFQLLADAQRHGARVALFGRKIKLAESPLEMVRHMRLVVDGERAPEDAVRAYHEAIRAKGLAPSRTLDDDLRVTEPALLPEPGGR